ncbi:MAG: HAD family hydrolase, partial [Oscillospiraceae bacterium]|nr:HAD family hydrolase [Oscillospiraceae bacterium]
MTRLSEKRLFLLDMDGTIYLSETLFDGTLDFLRHVRESGGRYLFLTNNSSRGTDAYVAKLARLGIEASAEDFLTSADATIDYLKK